MDHSNVLEAEGAAPAGFNEATALSRGSRKPVHIANYYRDGLQ